MMPAEGGATMVTTVSGSTDRTVELRGMRFHYVEWGESGSPPVVLLHGLTGHARIWDHTGARLADRFRLYALDQRGHGDTAWPRPPSYETEDFVADTLAFVDHLGLDRFALVGLSMGGHNAMAFAARYPARVTKLVIVDIMPALRMDRSPNWPEMERIAREGHVRFQSEDEAFAAARLGNPHAPDEHLRYRVALNLKPAEDGRLVWTYDHKAPVLWRPADLWPEVARITMPALLVRGGKTEVLPADIAERMVREFPDLRLVTIENAGHSVPTDRPVALADAIREFLQA
jgi:pimeloyl-ACP methyl ester carboxylesterase